MASITPQQHVSNRLQWDSTTIELRGSIRSIHSNHMGTLHLVQVQGNGIAILMSTTQF
jgi:hypothetical protein